LQDQDECRTSHPICTKDRAWVGLKRRFSFSHYCEKFRKINFRISVKICYQKYAKLTNMFATIQTKADFSVSFLEIGQWLLPTFETKVKFWWHEILGRFSLKYLVLQKIVCKYLFSRLFREKMFMSGSNVWGSLKKLAFWKKCNSFHENRMNPEIFAKISAKIQKASFISTLRHIPR
jgi:hypothetical protein